MVFRTARVLARLMIMSARGRARSGREDSSIQDRRKAAVDHALAVERHWVLAGLHALVGHHLLPALVARLLGRPFDPAVDDVLIGRGLHGALVVGDLAVGHVVA